MPVARAIETIEFLEVIGDDGSRTVTAKIRGTHEQEDENTPASLAYHIAAACFTLFIEGTLAKYVKGLYGIDIDGVKLESKA